MSDAYSQRSRQAYRATPQSRGIGSGRREWLGRAQHEHVPLAPACPDAVERRHARGLRRCRMPAAHARFRGRAGARRSRDRRHSGRRGRPDRERLQGRIIRPRRAGRGRDAVRQSRDPPGQGADRRCRQSRRRRRALRALGRDQPGRDRYRHHARPARRHRCAARRSRPRHRRLCQAGATASRHRGGRPHLAAARAADAVRAEARRICRGAAPLAHAAAAIAQRDAGAAVRRRRRHARRARRQGIGGRRTAGAGTQAAAARSALAHPSRPHRGGGLRVRHPRRHLRQDRPRRLADDADRRRRGLRAVGRRPRRLLHHAAQAQSRRGRERARRRHHGAQSRGDDFCRAGAGSRAQRRALARGMADLADAAAGHLGRARRHRRYRRRAGSRCRAHARQSRRHRTG